jgi:TatD DNase family protein
VSSLPALDLHAHLDVDIASSSLRELRAVVFAVTRSLAEAEAAMTRKDGHTVWGVGCHPGSLRAHDEFDATQFADLVGMAAFVSEVGLDRASRVPIDKQERTLAAILHELQAHPRITSVHSYQATDLVLAAIEAQPIRGCVLHWWLGDSAQTRRALDLGCFFSINASSVRRTDILDDIPFDRIITETDHPFGDRGSRPRARPGFVSPVEKALARHFGLPAEQIRHGMWDNFANLVSETEAMRLLPRGVRIQLMAR